MVGVIVPATPNSTGANGAGTSQAAPVASVKQGVNAGTEIGIGNAAAVAYDIDLIKRNALTRVLIQPISDSVGVAGADSVIEAWTPTEPLIGGAAQWASAYDDALLASSSLYITDALNRLPGAKSVGVFTYKFPAQTVKSWQGTGEFAINLELYFIASTADHDVRQDAARLLNLIYPIKSSQDANIIVAPLGHDMQGNGVSSVSIGTWFDADPIFVCNGVGNVFSAKPTKSAFPLYCKTSVEMVAGQLVTIDDVRRWMGQTAGTPVVNISGAGALQQGASGLLGSIEQGLSSIGGALGSLGSRLGLWQTGSSPSTQSGVSNSGASVTPTGAPLSIAAQVIANQRAGVSV